ncbi:MAG: hypothetical protein ACXWCW_26805 [Burkholderiales bacterium]
MDDPYLDLAWILDEDYVATRSFNDLLAEGIPHKGGLAMLAKAERDGTLFGEPGFSET